MKSKVRAQEPKGCVLWGFFGVFAAAGTAFFVFLAVLPVVRLVGAQGWIETPCRILSSQVGESHGDDGTTYRVDITYAYDFVGRSFQGNRYNFSIGYSSGYDGKARVVESYPPGSETLCFVDPDDPEESVINRAPGTYLLWGLFPLPFMAVGYGGLLWKIFAGRVRRPDRAPRAGRSSSVPAAAHGLRPAPSGMPVSTEAQGNQKLESQVSPKAKLLITIVVALFWNGLVSVFVFGVVIPSHRQGDPEWILTIFMVPFVLVGIGLIVAIFYNFLALFNPVLHVELDDGHLTNGESCTMAWWFTGNAGRIRKLSATFEGREAATYRRGTSTTTDHHVFFTQELFSITPPRDMSRGAATIQVPDDTMPTFKSSNNKIEWRVNVHGDIPFWPDVTTEFPVTVHPRRGGRPA